MSEDPETARQIAELSRDTRPLLVLDVDEVLIEFVRPFVRFLDGRGVELKLQTFRLYGNAIDRSTGRLLENEDLASLLEAFFEARPSGRPSPMVLPRRSPPLPKAPRWSC